MRVAIDSFRGEAPRVTPRGLPENAAQAAVNARLQSGDLESWRQFAHTQALVHSANVQTIYLLNDAWLSWEVDVDVARGAIPGDDTFRAYLTGPDLYDQPRFTNYALATTGSAPYPVTTRPLGVPAPDGQPTLEAGISTAPSSLTTEVSDSGDELTASWSTSPPVDLEFTRSIVSQDEVIGNGPPSYSLQAAENIASPAYMYRDFGVADSQVVRFSCDVRFRNSTRRRMCIVCLASSTGAGIGVQWSELGGLVIGITSSFQVVGFSALAGVDAGVPISDTDYTVTVQIVRNAAGTKTVTATVFLGSAQLATVTATNAFVNEGGNFGFVNQVDEPTTPDPISWYDNILVQGTAPTAALQQTATSYVYTFVNDLGEESAPSPPSATILKDDGTAITVTTATSAPSGFSVDYAVATKRIYRAVSGNTGTVFRFVAEIPLAQADYVDELTDAELGDVLETEIWDLPPDDLRGILALPNGIMAGFRRNQICFSVQNHPHAWPVEWRLNTDTDVVCIGNIDTTLVIGTQAFPYLAIGNDPSAYSMTKLEKKQACVSKRSVAYLTGIGVVFASPDGIIAINGNGSVRNLTETIFTRRQWQELVPETIIGVEHDDVYHFFTGTGESLPSALSDTDFIGSSRIIVPGYTDFCCRVRRTTGAVDADIGFIDGVVDSAAILAHCTAAGSEGTMHRLYNQLVPGNSDFASVLTPANGPKVVTLGAYVPKFGAFQVNQTGDTLNLPLRSIARSGLTIIIGADTTLNTPNPQHLWFWGTAASTFPNAKLDHASGSSTWIAGVYSDNSVKRIGKTIALNGGGSYQLVATTIDLSVPAVPVVLASVDDVPQNTVNNLGVYVPFSAFPSNQFLSVQGVAGFAGDSGLKLRDILLWHRVLTPTEVEDVLAYLNTLPGA